MFFAPDSTQKLVISGIYNVASVLSVILCPVVLYLLYLDRKRAAKTHTIFQMAIVCTSFFCDLFLGITNPVLLLPYPAVYCMSPIFNSITIEIWMAKNIFLSYVIGEIFIAYLFGVTFHNRLFLLRNDGRKIQNSPVFIACSTFIGIFLICFSFALQGLPFVDAEAIEREAVDEYGSGLYRLAVILGYFAWGILFPRDSDVLVGFLQMVFHDAKRIRIPNHSNIQIPDEILTFIKETPGSFYWVLNRSIIRYVGIFFLIFLILLVTEICFTVLRIFHFTYKLGRNIRSKQARQTQIGYVQILLLQFFALSLFYGLSFLAFFLSLVQDYVNLYSVSGILLAYVSWHSTVNCLILIFGAKTMRRLLFKKIKELWSTYHKFHREHSNVHGSIAGKVNQRGELNIVATTRVKPLTNNMHT